MCVYLSIDLKRITDDRLRTHIQNAGPVDFLEQKEALVKKSLRSLRRDCCASKALACSLQSLPLRRD